ERLLHIAPQFAFIRVSLKVDPPPLQLFALCGSDFDLLRTFSHAFPNLLNDRNSLSGRQFKNVVDWHLAHNDVILRTITHSPLPCSDNDHPPPPLSAPLR